MPTVRTCYARSRSSDYYTCHRAFIFHPWMKDCFIFHPRMKDSFIFHPRMKDCFIFHPWMKDEIGPRDPLALTPASLLLTVRRAIPIFTKSFRRLTRILKLYIFLVFNQFTPSCSRRRTISDKRDRTELMTDSLIKEKAAIRIKICGGQPQTTTTHSPSSTLQVNVVAPLSRLPPGRWYETNLSCARR
jgi:hypothetical protein